MSSTLDRSDKATRVQDVIRICWRTTSDREMAKIVDCSNKTIGNHRRKMESLVTPFLNDYDCYQDVTDGIWPHQKSN